MFQLPVNNLTRLRKARKKVKRLLSDIGLDYCKEHVEDYQESDSDEVYSKHYYLDLCLWDPSWTKSQDYRTKQFCCSDCPFASKYFSAYKNHFRNVHREDFENRILLNCSYCMYSGNKRTLETHVRLFHMPQNVVRQGVANPQASAAGVRDGVRIDKPMLTDRKELPVYYCKKCTFRDRLYNIVRRHIYREHFQHVATSYVAKNSEKQNRSEASTANSHGIHCKSCLFVPRSYEALVQHVIEFHERIGHQVTAMIGHTNVIVARPQANVVQRGATITPVLPPHMATSVNRFNVHKGMGMPVGNHFKQGAQSITLPDKALLSSAVLQPHAAGKHFGGFVGNSSFSPSMKSLPLSSVHAATATLTSMQAKKAQANALNTSQTQKWKICTICNELFPESAYSAHFEKEHQAEKVRAMAKYIMKIHNFTSKCLYCNRYLPSDSLLNHMLVHGLTCPQCHSVFYEVETIVAHKRQAHSNEPGETPAGSPLTFDLTLQQGSPKNVQLLITTYNMKEASEAASVAGQPPNSAIGRSAIPAKGLEKHNELLMRNTSQNAVSHQKKEVGKTLCPLCFTILKGPISDALAHHLRDRHQVLQTLHPVEKKLTYKCIHCLGVYTSNMTASTITLHLVHCRGVGQSPKGPLSKSISAMRSSGPGSLKRELIASDAIDPKRRKMVDQSRYYPTVFVEKAEEPVVLALDPKAHADGSYEARKSFLTTYFNQRPYPLQREVEKLAASLWLWKSDVSSHFANRRRSCERDFVTRKPVVLLGFNMQAVNKVSHDMNFGSEWLFTVNPDESSGVSRTSKLRLKGPPIGFHAAEGTKALQFKGTRQALNTGESSRSNCAFIPAPGTSLEPIAIDSDSEPETDEMAMDALKVKPKQAGAAALSESFLYERDGKVSRNPPGRVEGKVLDGSGSGSRPDEVIWTGSMSPNQSHYRPAGRFEEKGKEVGLLGR